jgi:uncharacterized phiE125 gp8 family phage protein
MFSDSRGGHYSLPPIRASVVKAGAPESEIVSLEAMKDFLRIDADITANDARIRSLIVSARAHAERYTGLSLVKTPFVMALDRFPNLYADRTDKINLWYPPLSDADVTITYIDRDGNEQSIASGTDFQVDPLSRPGRVAPLVTQCWPPTSFRAMNAVRIFYTAGYEAKSSERPEGDADNLTEPQPETELANQVPATHQVTEFEVDRTPPNDLVTAIMQLVVHWYQNRDPVLAQPGAGGSFSILPWHVEDVLARHIYESLTPTITPEY